MRVVGGAAERISAMIEAQKKTGHGGGRRNETQSETLRKSF
jgi:hypothetical protein